MKGLALHDVSLRAGAHGRVLCSGVNAVVEPGQRWVLLGPNGAGKSTLLATLAGLLTPSQGTITLHGLALDEWPLAELARERAWCPPHWTDPFPATVAETVRLARRHADDTLALRALLDQFDVAPLASADVRTLSGGERQRVALATAWWQGAPLLLLDEPTAHLDLSHQELLVTRMQEHGGSVVASLHDLNLAWRVATHALLLDGRGGVVVGTRDEVLAPERLGHAFGVPVAWVEVCGQRRLWVGPMERAA
jgi:iron complex transport system ATP-binding protein